MLYIAEGTGWESGSENGVSSTADG